MQHFSYDHLHQFTYDMLQKIGCPDEDAQLATKVLLSADLRGVDSHGVARLSGYVRLWEKGRINATPKLRVSYETPSTAVVDGDGGLGLVVAPFAMKVAMEKAIPLALKKAKPGTPEFRAAMRDTLETMGRTVFSHGVMNWTPADHWGYTMETGVMTKVVDGKFKVE